MRSSAHPRSGSEILFVDLPDDFALPTSSWSLGYRYLIASLRKAGFSARILHPPRTRRDGRERMIRTIVESDAALIGITTYDAQLHRLLPFVRDLRRAGFAGHVTLGGLCASAAPDALLAAAPWVDSVVTGEGEATIVQLADRVVRGEGADAICNVWNRTGPPPPCAGRSSRLDDLPPPVLDDFTDGGDVAPMFLNNGCVPTIASRGCYGRCTFCCIPDFYRSSGGKPWRGRDASLVADEVARVTAATGRARFTFVDENFMGPGRMGRLHAQAIADAILAQGRDIEFNFACRANDVEPATMRKLRDAGLRAVTLGIESMSGRALAAMGKGTTPEDNRAALAILSDLQILTEITFIFFTPCANLDDVEVNLEFVAWVRRSKTAYFSGGWPFTEFVPFQRTPMTERYEAEGLVERHADGPSARYRDPAVGFIAACIAEIPREKLMRLRDLLVVAGGQRLADLSGGVEAYAERLALVRIPELTWDLVGLFRDGARVDDERVQKAADAFRAESAQINEMVARTLGKLS